MERYVEVPGGRLFAMSEGQGPPIVLLHAFVANLRAWDSMVPGLVGAGYRVVRYDCRTFGASTTADVEFSHRSDLVAVLDAMEIERAALVGNSGGGRIAFDTAIEFPERVVAAVGIGAGLDGFDSGEATPAELALNAEWIRLEAASPKDPDAITELGLRVWLDGPGQPPDRVDASIREALRAMSRPLNEPARILGRPIELAPPANERLHELRCPVLAVAGAYDVAAIAATASRLATGAPNARAMVLPGVAHMIGMEAPATMNAIIGEFLTPLRPWA